MFTSGGSCNQAQSTLSGQAMKALFKMNIYSSKFGNVSVKHRLGLFDKLIMPIMSYSAEVWGFNKSLAIERVHTCMVHCRRILNVKKSTQNDFKYG